MPEPKNIRNSHQREVILEELRKLKTHPTAASLYKQVSKRLPKISLGTVYRNLDLLTRQGIIRKLDIDGSQARFDGDTDLHYHIFCRECGKIDDIYNYPKSINSIDIPKTNGYAVEGYRINFYGICSDCRNNQ